VDNGKHTELANHAWSVADLLRGDYKQSDYGKVILPFTVLRRLECVLEPTKDKVLQVKEQREGQGYDLPSFLRRATGGLIFYNTSRYNLAEIAKDHAHAATHLAAYIGAFSQNARDVLEKFEFPQQIKRLDAANLLYQVIARFADLDLRPEVVSNHQMGYMFEELIRRFAELSNETAGEHFTPREVIELMVNILVAPHGDVLSIPGISRSVLDPACGTGGMLTAMQEHIMRHNPDATVTAYGQELNPESWAICAADLLIKGQDPSHVAFGNHCPKDVVD
jgi:type I restriction enzyme M protein